MKTKILFLLTADYPYGTGETFLEAEIEALAEQFSQVYIFSGSNNQTVTRPLPVNVTALKLSYAPGKGTKAGALCQLFSKEVWNDRRRIRSLGALKTALVSQANSKRIAMELAKHAHKYVKADEANQLVVYSYWLNDFALAAYHLKNKWPQIKAVARAHRWDIYEEEQPLGYLPFRTSLLQVLDTVYTISEDGTTYLQQYQPTTPIRCFRLGTFQPQPLATFNAPPVFTLLSISQVIPRKRLHLLWQVIQQMSIPVHWVHFGDGPDREALMRETQAAENKMHQVSWMGHQDNETVKSKIAALQPHLLINLSDSEGIPVSMMEAMSSGIPVVATRVGGVPEIVEPGVNGWLVPPNPSVTEVVELLTQIAALSPSEYHQLRQSTYRYWKEKYNAALNFKAFASDLARNL